MLACFASPSWCQPDLDPLAGNPANFTPNHERRPLGKWAVFQDRPDLLRQQGDRSRRVTGNDACRL